MATEQNGRGADVSDRDIYLVIRRALLAVIGIFDRKFNVRPTEK